MTTMSPDLAEWLLEQIAEDELQAMRARDNAGSWSSGSHMVAWTPARVLAECKAKRRIIAAHKEQVEEDDPHAWIVDSEVLLKSLALPFADRPGYRPEWAPS